LPQKQYKITVLVDSATVPDKDPQFLNLPPKPTTEYNVIQTLRKLGHTVIITPVEESLAAIARQLKQQKPDLVFNLTEEFKGDRRKDKVITSMLSNTKIPFTGTDSQGLAICRNKIRTKQILAKHKINVPNYLLFPQGKTVKIPKNAKFPMVVKPVFEDGSEGISNASIVNNERTLKKRVKFVTKKWKQPAIAEEYIKGRELYVAIIGNKKPTALPIRECIFNRGAEGPCLATYRVKWNEKYRRKWNVKFGFAKLDKTTTKKIYQVCKQVYGLLHLRDYGRIDLRLTAENKIVVLEVNANPDVKYSEDLAEAAKKAGITYKEFIAQIISNALARYRQQKIRSTIRLR
jgi:D-alanine-D-alanine ligase